MPTLDKEAIERALLIIGLSSTIYPMTTSVLYRWRIKSRDKRINIPTYKVRSAVLVHKASFAGYILAIILSNIILFAFYSKHVGLGTLILSVFCVNMCHLTFGAATNATLLLHFNDKKWHVVHDFEVQVRGVESGNPPRRSWVIQAQVDEEHDYPVRTVEK